MIWIVPAIVLVVPLVGLYFQLVRWLDRYHPAPGWRLGLCLAWGALGALRLSVVGDRRGPGGMREAGEVGLAGE